MPNNKVKLITHPMRARILTALTGRNLTIGQLSVVLSDIPVPSLYRHVRQLIEGNILTVVEEIRVNGALTKVYGIHSKKSTLITPDDMQNEPVSDHLQYFTSFTGMLDATFRNYIGQDGSDPRKDNVAALMTVLELSPEEYREFCTRLQQLLQKSAEHPRSENAQRLIFAHIVIPDRSDPPLS